VADVLVAIIPIVVGAALMPGWVVLALLLLQRPDGVLAGAAFIGGMTAVRLLQELAFGTAFASLDEARDSGQASVIVSTIFVVMGLAMWATAIGQMVRRNDPDAPPSHWLASLQTRPAAILVAFGAILVITSGKQWMFMLATMGTIRQGDLNLVEAVIVYLLYVVGAGLLLILPIVAVATGQVRSVTMVRRAEEWLESQSRHIVIVVSAVFGAWFLWKGFAGLAG
jgi:hypothetical protein